MRGPTNASLRAPTAPDREAFMACGRKRRGRRPNSPAFPDFFRPCFELTFVNCRACRPWCKARYGRFRVSAVLSEPLDDVVVCVRADDGCGDLRGALAVESRRAAERG